VKGLSFILFPLGGTAAGGERGMESGREKGERFLLLVGNQ